jgi:HAD superfamily hydrolase (TIGR01509 family)
MPRPIRAVLCDADGTLIDSMRHGLYKLRISAERFGFVYEESYALAHWGMPLDKLLYTLFPALTSEQYEGMLQIFNDLDYETPPGAIEGVIETLALLGDNGIIFTIVTSRDSTTLAHLLKHNGIDHHFRHIAAEDTVEFLKPHPQVFDCTFRMLADHQIEPDECLFIGDTHQDFDAGIARGLRTVIVKTGPLSGPDERIPEADHIQSFAELPDWLRRNGVHP